MNETVVSGVSRTRRMWERRGNPPPLSLQPRDDRMLELVFRHRFLQPQHLHPLLGGRTNGVSLNNLKRRCRLLWEHRYLDRPRAARPLRALTEEIIYGLGKKGAQRLDQLDPGLRIGHLDWGDQPGWPYVDHQIKVAEFLVALQLACERRGFTLQSPGHYQRRRFRIKVPGNRDPILPDAVFLIRRPDGRAAVHYLELDRGSVSLVRMKRRYENYFRWWKHGGAMRLFKSKRIRVLTVTEDPRHLDALRRIATPIGREAQFPHTWKGLMFSHLEAFSLAEPERILSPIFRYADEEAPVSLV